MSEEEKQDDPSSRLLSALRDMIAKNGKTEYTPTAAAPNPVNLLFLGLLTLNTAFLIYLIPSHFIEGPHWELLKDVGPIVGGSLLAITASWYKEQTLRICSGRKFRIAQIAIATLFVLTQVIPSARVLPVIEPAEGAVIFVDGSDKCQLANEPIVLSLRPHKFKVEWVGEGKENGQTHQRTFDMSLGETIFFGFGAQRPHWVHLYKVKFQSEETPGISVKITPRDGTHLDRAFQKNELAERALLPGDHGEVIFLLPDTPAPFAATELPKGFYDFTPSKAGCLDGKPITTRVDENTEEVKFQKLACS